MRCKHDWQFVGWDISQCLNCRKTKHNKKFIKRNMNKKGFFNSYNEFMDSMKSWLKPNR